MPGSKIVLPSSDVYEYSGTVLCSTVSRIVNPKKSKYFYMSDNRPNWWPKDVVFCSIKGTIVHSHIIMLTVDMYVQNLLLQLFCCFLGHKTNITSVNQRTILAAFLEKCPEQYTM